MKIELELSEEKAIALAQQLYTRAGQLQDVVTDATEIDESLRPLMQKVQAIATLLGLVARDIFAAVKAEGDAILAAADAKRGVQK